MAKLDIPKELIDKAYQAFSAAKESGKIRKGTNETTKAIERKQALLVAIAQDVAPQEVVMHLPVLCDEKEIPYIYVPRKDELGKLVGLTVPTASAAIIDAGSAKSLITDLATKLKDLKAGKKSTEAPKVELIAEKKAEAPKAPKPEVKPAKKESKKEEKK